MSKSTIKPTRIVILQKKTPKNMMNKILFGILLVLLVSSDVIALNNSNNFCNVGFTCGAKGQSFGPYISPPLLPIVDPTRITHNGFIVSNDVERQEIVNRFSSIGFNQWSPLNNVSGIAATYCGNQTTLSLVGQIAPSVDGLPITGRAFLEIIQFVRIPGERTLFSDYYDTYGPKLFYVGMNALQTYPNMASVIDALNTQNIPVLFTYNFPAGGGLTVPVVFAQIGNQLIEIAIGVTNLII
jgi:hypothetical protein